MHSFPSLSVMEYVKTPSRMNPYPSADIVPCGEMLAGTKRHDLPMLLAATAKNIHVKSLEIVVEVFHLRAKL